jgi:hypothetical protein
LKERTPTVVVVSYRYKAEYKPIAKVLRDSFPIWGKDSVFKPFSDDEMWTDAGEQEVFLWFIEPDREDGLVEHWPAR